MSSLFLLAACAQAPAELVLRTNYPFNYCVIDEVDSILIDEARTPLIISGTSDKPSDKYYKAAKIADALTKDLHYTVDEKQRNVLLTEDGYEAVEDVLQVCLWASCWDVVARLLWVCVLLQAAELTLYSLVAWIRAATPCLCSCSFHVWSCVGVRSSQYLDLHHCAA